MITLRTGRRTPPLALMVVTAIEEFPRDVATTCSVLPVIACHKAMGGEAWQDECGRCGDASTAGEAFWVVMAGAVGAVGAAGAGGCGYHVATAGERR